LDALIRTAFQPIMSARGHIVAYEALLRFREGLEKPESRMAAIRRWEDTGYIATVDVAVLKQAIAALDLLHPSLSISVNISSLTVNTQRERYLRHLRGVGDLAKRLVVELTESGSPLDPQAMLLFARESASLGVRLALDDCAPGLPRCDETVLRMLRPKLVKLERKALSTAFQSVADEQLRELIQRCASVGARVVAQGIASQEKFDWSYGLGVRYFQGFLVGHPRQFPLLDEKASFRTVEFTQPPAELGAAAAP
jgi:EAL domain-containing protein (putative c-di-GMP-specific phosphodiesterase class I)